MSLKNRLIAAAGGVGLTLAIAVTAVSAGGVLGSSAAPAASASTAPTTVATAPSLGDMGGFTLTTDSTMVGLGGAAADPSRCQDVRDKFAANLGVTTDQLQAAIKKTALQEIDAAVASGKLTADQAQTMRDRINNATDLCADFAIPGMAGGAGGPAGGTTQVPGGRGPGGAMQGGMMIQGMDFKAVASYLGISTDQLQQDLKDTGSLQGVAAKYGKDNDAGKAGLKAAIEKSLRDELAQRNVPQATIDQIVSQFTANFDTIYTAKLGQGMPFGPGDRTPGQFPGHGPAPSGAPSSAPSAAPKTN